MPKKVQTTTPGEEPSSVIYIGHLPKGFAEDALQGYFSQFGNVTRVAVSRSQRTGGLRGFAFVEFEEPAVAAIAAETMDKYALGGKVVQCHVVDRAKLHDGMFAHAGDKTLTRTHMMQRRRAGIVKEEALRASRSAEVRAFKEVRKGAVKLAAKLAARGIDYEVPLPPPMPKRVKRVKAAPVEAAAVVPAVEGEPEKVAPAATPAAAAAKPPAAVEERGKVVESAKGTEGKKGKRQAAAAPPALPPAAAAVDKAAAAPPAKAGKRPRSVDAPSNEEREDVKAKAPKLAVEASSTTAVVAKGAEGKLVVPAKVVESKVAAVMGVDGTRAASMPGSKAATEKKGANPGTPATGKKEAGIRAPASTPATAVKPAADKGKQQKAAATPATAVAPPAPSPAAAPVADVSKGKRKSMGAAPVAVAAVPAPVAEAAPIAPASSSAAPAKAGKRPRSTSAPSSDAREDVKAKAPKLAVEAAPPAAKSPAPQSVSKPAPVAVKAITPAAAPASGNKAAAAAAPVSGKKVADVAAPASGKKVTAAPVSDKQVVAAAAPMSGKKAAIQAPAASPAAVTATSEQAPAKAKKTATTPKAVAPPAANAPVSAAAAPLSTGKKAAASGATVAKSATKSPKEAVAANSKPTATATSEKRKGKKAAAV